MFTCLFGFLLSFFTICRASIICWISVISFVFLFFLFSNPDICGPSLLSCWVWLPITRKKAKVRGKSVHYPNISRLSLSLTRMYVPNSHSPSKYLQGPAMALGTIGMQGFSSEQDRLPALLGSHSEGDHLTWTSLSHDFLLVPQLPFQFRVS